MEYNIEGKIIKVLIVDSLPYYTAGIFDIHLKPIDGTRVFNTRRDAEKWLKEKFEILFPKHKHIYRGV
jgi:hypothetical protein